MSTGARTPVASAAVERQVAVRWRDLDPLGHVGHVAYLEYFEEARNALLERHGLTPEAHVVASATVNYRREIPSGTTAVTVRSHVVGVGRTSVTTREELVGVDGEPLADATAVVVLWDAVARGPRAVTDVERTSFEGREG